MTPFKVNHDLLVEFLIWNNSLDKIQEILKSNEKDYLSFTSTNKVIITLP